jgi:hypothetical protein
LYFSFYFNASKSTPRNDPPVSLIKLSNYYIEKKARQDNSSLITGGFLSIRQLCPQ